MTIISLRRDSGSQGIRRVRLGNQMTNKTLTLKFKRITMSRLKQQNKEKKSHHIVYVCLPSETQSKNESRRENKLGLGAENIVTIKLLYEIIEAQSTFPKTIVMIRKQRPQKLLKLLKSHCLCQRNVETIKVIMLSLYYQLLC